MVFRIAAPCGVLTGIEGRGVYAVLGSRILDLDYVSDWSYISDEGAIPEFRSRIHGIRAHWAGPNLLNICIKIVRLGAVGALG